jgi:hypothetical protein
MEWLIWLANPIYFTASILLLCHKKISVYFSISATLIALSFSTWKELLVSENGRQAEIASLNSGYFLWLSSMIILSAGALYNYRKRSRQIL